MGETIDQYVTDLRTKAHSCEFGELRDSLIRDHIICGIICDKTRGILLREGDISLQRTVEICRANEAVTSQLKAISHTTTDITTEAEIHPIRTTAKKLTDKPACNRCGYKHTLNQTCPHMVQSAASAVVRTTLQRFADPKLLSIRPQYH